MPARIVAAAFAAALYQFSTSSRYPTRTVESFIAWVLLVWSGSVLADPAMLTVRAAWNVYGPMLQLMSPIAWGWLGIAIAATRIAALVVNGHFRASPELRLVGAAWGLAFWLALAWCYYKAVVIGGGADFPMRRALYVFAIFEAYSCYRCGIDIGRREQNEARARAGDDAAGAAGNG